ncbi:hypothetical protein HOY82DRAFT_95410 [Tuber indicum]|nr:hypothetical protein HOY82DRAFT_95410 [Tuber indicum]
MTDSLSYRLTNEQSIKERTRRMTGELKADAVGRAFRVAYAPNTVTRADPRPAPRTTPRHQGRLVAPCQTPQGRWRRQTIAAHYSLSPQPRMHRPGALRRRSPTRMHKYSSNPWSTSPITTVPFNQPGDACRSACRATTRILSFCWEVKNHAEAKMYSANRCLHGITPVEMRKHMSAAAALPGFSPKSLSGRENGTSTSPSQPTYATSIAAATLASQAAPQNPTARSKRNIHSLPSQPAHNPHHPNSLLDAASRQRHPRRIAERGRP